MFQAGPVRRASDRSSRREEPFQSTSASRPSIFQRLGAPDTGAVVHFNYLNNNVEAFDLEDLCKDWEVTDIRVERENLSIVNGTTATVKFAKHSQAVACCKKYDQIPLDGTPMRVKIISTQTSPTPTPAPIPAQQFQPAPKMPEMTFYQVPQPMIAPVPVAPTSTFQPKHNVKAGLFGTKLAQMDHPSFSVDLGGQSVQREMAPVPQVSFSAFNQRPQHQGQRNPRPQSQGQGRQVQAPRSHQRQQGRGGGGAGGRGKPRADPVTAEDLDAELDSFMGNSSSAAETSSPTPAPKSQVKGRGKGKKASEPQPSLEDLDAELDSYRASKN